MMKKLFFVAAALILSVITFAQQDNKQITLEDVWKDYTFYPKTVNGLRSMNDGKVYTILSEGKKVEKYSYKSGKLIQTLFNLDEVEEANKPESISDYEFSSDESQILIVADVEAIYRHSFKANYYIWDIKAQTLKELSDNGKQQLATFSPDGSRIAFVRENNIFIKDLAMNQEQQITTDGESNKIINGAPDWVYEEEFSFSKAFEWSPDGNKIAFYRFDESKVKQFTMPMYGTLYPELYQFKYPKAGEENSIVTIHVYDLVVGTTRAMEIGEETDQYIPRIKWTKDPNILSIVRLNRLQNHYELLFAQTTGDAQVVLSEKDQYYVEINDDLTYLDDKKHFILTSEKDGYNHIYLYDVNGTFVRQITKGEWEVTKYYGYDAKSQKIYYQSTESSPLQRDVYTINLDGTGKTKLSQKAGWNKADFSKGFKYFINYHSDANSPYYVTLHTSKGKQIKVLEDNESLKAKMKEYNFKDKEFFTFTTSENVELNGWMIKPADFDENKQYPVYMFLYGGPGSQQVEDAWNYNMVWQQALAQRGYIVACVDNRGTGARGAEFKKCTYGQLGKLETIDQIEAAKYLGSQSYIDAERISIQGWSFGGYMSTLCLTKGADVFKMAIAVAPVSNWRYYDSIYTERYMGLPKDNAEGYDDNSPINHVEKMKGPYLLVHGTADDNVHFQNAVELTDALIKANKQFDMQFYPNKNHGIYGGNTRLHLFTKIFDFVEKNL